MKKSPPFLRELPDSDWPWIVTRHEGKLICLNVALPPMEVCEHGPEYLWIRGKLRSEVDAICTKALPDIDIEKFLN